MGMDDMREMIKKKRTGGLSVSVKKEIGGISRSPSTSKSHKVRFVIVPRSLQIFLRIFPQLLFEQIKGINVGSNLSVG